MTMKELSQLYWLEREIRAEEKRLEELRRLAGVPSSPQLTGMPHGTPNSGSLVERMAAEIVDLQAIIAAKRIQCIHERNRLERWINDIPDSLTRQFFRCRFVMGMTWREVADTVGENTSVEKVKKRCERYLEQVNL